MDVSNADIYELLIMIFFLLLAGGLILLQYFLCKHKKGRIFGMILPILSCIFSIPLSLLVMIFALRKSSGLATISFLMINIPAAVFTGEYFIVRDIRKKKEQAAEELNRTRINDL